MKDLLDFDGKSVEQAVYKACQELHVPKEKLAYDIISYGSTGIFGLVGTKKALIRVTPPETQIVHGPSAELGESDAYVPAENPVENNAAAPVSEKDNRSAINALIDEAFGEGSEEAVSEATPQTSAFPSERVATDEAISVAEDLLSQILSLLSPEAEISVQRDPDQCRIHISGGETAILIGRKGQTLESMQYLVDKALNKQCGKGFRIVIDVEGYLETRRNELKDLASRLAEKAFRTGKPSTMNLMSAHDRRIVHLALKNNKSVRTQSIGDGYYRKLMILPKRRKNPAKTKGRSRQNQ